MLSATIAALFPHVLAQALITAKPEAVITLCASRVLQQCPPQSDAIVQEDATLQ